MILNLQISFDAESMVLAFLHDLEQLAIEKYFVRVVGKNPKIRQLWR